MRGISRRAFVLTLMALIVQRERRLEGRPSPPIEGLRAAHRGKVAMVRSRALAKAEPDSLIKAAADCASRALEALVGRRGSDAWKALFSPEDRVAIKVNALGGRAIATNAHMAQGIARCLVEAGVPPRQIVIWDRSTRELSRAGYTIRKRGGGPMCFGTDVLGYEDVPRLYGRIGSCFSPILTRWATALVDMPVLKDHDLAGVSISIKNLFGAIHNPNKYHDEGCAPYLVDLLGCDQIQGKLRLVVCDAHRAQCHGGPAYAPRWNWPFGGMMLAADPVALDRIGQGIIEDRRRAMGLPSLKEEGRPPRHIQLACARGLGEGRLDAIRLIEPG